MKIPKGYHVSGQGWPKEDKKGALRAAKSLRKIGFKARVAFDGKWYRVLIKG